MELLAKKLIFFSIIPLILSIGIVPATPFVDAGMQEVSECRRGQVLVYHLNHGYYICTSESNAKRWADLGIAELKVCRADQIKIYHNIEGYVCRSGDTAKRLIQLGIAEYTTEKDIKLQEFKEIAEQAFIYSYPLLENYKTMYTSTDESSEFFVAPFNEFNHSEKLATPDDKWVVSPNSDTLYSRAWLDLRAEPIVLTIPPIEENRYYTFQLVDFFTHNFGYIGTRETGNDGGVFLIAGPNWEGGKHKNIRQIFYSETDIVAIAARTQVLNNNDVSNTLSIMEQYDLKLLGEFLGEPQLYKAPKINFIPWDAEKAYSSEFVNYLNLILRWSPIHSTELQLFDEFSKIDIKRAKVVDFASMEPVLKMNMDNGVDFALEKINNNIFEAGEFVNGWITLDVFGNRAFHGTNYLNRATGAMFGLYGNSIDEAFYPYGTSDMNKDLLDANKSNYVIEFNEEPPVDAFWSVTMYYEQTKFLVENPIDRWVINSLTDLEKNDDGSFTIYVQHDTPLADKQNNWLPAPDGQFYMLLRLYLPDETIIDGTWELPTIKKVQETKISEIEETVSVACTLEYEPVCGTDEQTYGNMCMLNASDIQLDYAGECIEQKIVYENGNYRLVEVAPNVYSFGDGNTFSMVLPTTDGVIIADPINQNHSEVMLDAINTVFDMPVKYLIYSHNHWDHISGGQIFKSEGATILSHTEVRDWLDEHPNPNVVIPDQVWKGNLNEIILGGATLELRHFGPSHGEGMTVFYLPDEKIIFIVDIVTPKRIAFTILPDFVPSEWERTLTEVEKLDFDTAMFSHKRAYGPASEVTEMREYLEDLRAEIFSMMQDGVNPMIIPSTIELPKYQEWEFYDEWLEMNAWRVMLESWMGW